MFERARQLLEAAPVYFWAWWQHTPLPRIEYYAPPVEEPARSRPVDEDTEDPSSKRQRTDSTESFDNLSHVSEAETECGPWGGALALLEENNIDDDLLKTMNSAIDQCLDGCMESHDIVLVNFGMAVQRSLSLNSSEVISDIRSMVDAQNVPDNCMIVYDFVQLEPRLRRAATRVESVSH